jgi:hypothetical protein
MYEQVGRYYALFGPTAATTAAEERFLAHWTQSRTRALDFGAGLCGPALVLSRLGLEVLAFEPSPVIATLALDRLSRDCGVENSFTLVEGPTPTFDVPFRADFILMRSVVMLLNDSDRAAHSTLSSAMRRQARDSSLTFARHTSRGPIVAHSRTKKSWAARSTVEGSPILGRRSVQLLCIGQPMLNSSGELFQPQKRSLLFGRTRLIICARFSARVALKLKSCMESTTLHTRFVRTMRSSWRSRI